MNESMNHIFEPTRDHF